MINLLPYKQRKIIGRIRTLKVINTTLIVLIILGVAAAFLLLPTFITINSRYELTRAQVDSLEKQGVITSDVDIQSLDARTKDLEKKLAAPLETPPTALISSIRTLAGKDISLTGFTLETGEAPKLTVTGIAATREALQAYIETLKTQSNINNVDSPIANYVKSKDADFTIVVFFKK